MKAYKDVAEKLKYLRSLKGFEMYFGMRTNQHSNQEFKLNEDILKILKKNTSFEIIKLRGNGVSLDSFIP